jgi:hypothetical protein
VFQRLVDERRIAADVHVAREEQEERGVEHRSDRSADADREHVRRAASNEWATGSSTSVLR